MTRIRATIATFLGVALPAGLIAWIYWGDWRHAAAGLILAITGLVIFAVGLPRTHARGGEVKPWPSREDLPEEEHR